jgi:hypothetical protein
LPRVERGLARCLYFSQRKHPSNNTFFRKLGPVISVDECSAHLLMRQTPDGRLLCAQARKLCVSPDRGVFPHGVPLYSISIWLFFFSSTFYSDARPRRDALLSSLSEGRE